MSEEEAIELLKEPPDYSLSYYKREKAIEVLLNLIEKQQAEIEKKDKQLQEKEKNNKELYREIDRLQEENECFKIASQRNFAEEFMKVNYISKDKIREKIEFIKNLNEKIYYEENVISILQELLEERN